MTTARVPVRLSRCRGRCAIAVGHRDHHDRLLAVDTDLDVLLELVEIAVTWHELDYSESSVVGPPEWLTFAAAHRWSEPERAERAFGLAVDIVGRHATSLAPDAPLAEVVELAKT